MRLGRPHCWTTGHVTAHACAPEAHRSSALRLRTALTSDSTACCVRCVRGCCGRTAPAQSDAGL
eukprot:358571-Chlamydomonas_euryale.AAC.1